MSKDLQLRLIFWAVESHSGKHINQKGFVYLWNTFLSFELFVAVPGFSHCRLDLRRMGNGATQGCSEKMMHHHNFSTSRFKSNGMSTPPSKSTQQTKKRRVFSMPTRVCAISFLTASVNLPTSNVGSSHNRIRQGYAVDKKTKDYS